MAKDAKPAEEGAEAPPKKSKKLLIIIVAVVLLLVIGGGAAAFFLLKGDDEHADEEEVAAETEKPAKKKDKKKEEHPPVFVNMEAFTVNLVPETGDQYLQVILSVELEGPEAEAELKAHLPKIRNDVTLLLSSKKASELLPKEGKEALAVEIQDAINSAISPPKKNKRGEMVAPDGPVHAVLFTSFIIQ
ncbi:MAG: flagellar basal body-associated FliL family protein [Dechloromonas sp.]|nr:flagellar basal body-associated FliL family protein [Dechloromonas sp.]